MCSHRLFIEYDELKHKRERKRKGEEFIQDTYILKNSHLGEYMFDSFL